MSIFYLSYSNIYTSNTYPKEMADYQKVMVSKVEKLNNSVAIWKTWSGYQLVVRGFDNILEYQLI